MWVRAILWEYNENYNDKHIKELLLHAQQRHPESQKIYLTFFKIELENKRQSHEIEALQHAEIVYTSSKKKFTNIEFYIEMLSIVSNFSFARSLEQHILEDMRIMFVREEILWHTLAQRELNGQSSVDCTIDFKGLIKLETNKQNYEDDIKVNFKKLKIEDISVPVNHTLRKRIQLCVLIYDEAVKVVSEKKNESSSYMKFLTFSMNFFFLHSIDKHE